MSPAAVPSGSAGSRAMPAAQSDDALERPPEIPDSRTSDSPEPALPTERVADSTAPLPPRVVEPDPDPRDENYPPAGGIAATAAVVLGGAEAFAAAYEKYGATERAERMLELETALAEYVHGEPKDELGQARYAAFKDELYWWRENRR